MSLSREQMASKLQDTSRFNWAGGNLMFVSGPQEAKTGEDSEKSELFEAETLDNGGTSPIMNTTNPTEQEDGAPAGNQNAAGPHKRKHLSPADKARYTKRIVGQTTSDGVKITGFSGHAFDRVAQRNVSAKRIEAMIRSAKVSQDKKHPNRRCYDVKGSRLVLDHTTGTIVTIEWRNQNR